MKKLILAVAGVSILFASVLPFILSLPGEKLFVKPVLFFSDPTIPETIHSRTVMSHDTKYIILTRVFENKLLFSLDNVLVSFSRIIDPVFLFSLYPKSAYYYGGVSPSSLFPALEFPFSFLAFLILIRNWNFVKKKYRFLLPLLVGSVIFASIWLPYDYAPFKLIPLLISIQTLTLVGLYEFLLTLPWLKKLFSSA